MAKITSNTVNRYGVSSGVWITYQEAEEEKFNRVYQLILDKKYEFVQDFTPEEKEFLDKNFEKIIKYFTKLLISEKIA